MKRKSINKILTAVLSASMLMGSSLPALAADGEVEAPIYSLDVINVIVPTTYAVAFNPEGLSVKTGTVSGGDVAVTSTDQILSKNYGIINKSSKDKVITVALTVEDLNTDSGITFVNSAEEVTGAEEGEYKIHLTAIPANGTEVTVSGDSADQDTTGEALSDVEMTKAAAGKEVTLNAGENYIGFKLDKAVWTAKSGADVTLGETNSNDVKDNFEVTALAVGGKGITAFTFGGEMNENADWSKLTKGIKISVVYGNEKASSDLTPIDGTGAMVTLNIAPTFATGSEIGQIKYSKGAGDDGMKEITKITLPLNDKVHDGYHASSTKWSAATDKNGVITFDSNFMAYWKTGAPVEATVTYVTNGDETKTAKVDVLREIVNAAPTFTTGDGVGQIKYTPGAGDEGLKEIQKIEMTISNKDHDGYHASGTKWSAATDENGVITFDSKYIEFWNAYTTFEARVTYETNSGETRTASVDVKCK